MIEFPTITHRVLMEFLEEHKVLVSRYLVRQISHALKNNVKVITLFQVKNRPIVGLVPKHSYLEALEKAKELFIKEEEYEAAAKTNKVIDEYHIIQLIESSTRIEK
jgi:GTP-binding protein EngB required for normal cell division